MITAVGASPSAPLAATRWSQVLLAGGDSPQARAALAWLCQAYWDALHAHARRRGWRDADDAVQDFWLRLLERGSLVSADPARGRFRTWLLACLDHHLADRHDAAFATKRGGGRIIGPLLDADGAAAPQAADGFDRAWARTLLDRARQRLAREQGDEKAKGRLVRLERFLTDNGDGTAYAMAAADLGLSEGAVKVAVHRLRARFGDCLRLEVAETLADPTPAAIDAELGDLLAALDGV
jgi:DNA-directed RNA polymerase specialized sigma24 family protein